MKDKFQEEQTNKQKGKTKEEGKMAVISKPSVFEVKVTEKTKQDVINEINEVRLTRSFFDECAKISKQFTRKDKAKDE